LVDPLDYQDLFSASSIQTRIKLLRICGDNSSFLGRINLKTFKAIALDTECEDILNRFYGILSPSDRVQVVSLVDPSTDLELFGVIMKLALVRQDEDPATYAAVIRRLCLIQLT
jgi:hypothetical protein